MTKPLCSIVGVGPGIGMAVARRFAQEGFQLALLARNPQKLQGYVEELHKAGYEAHAFPTDAADEDSIHQSFYRLHEELGTKTSVLIYNAAALNQGLPSELIYDDAVQDFRVNVLGAAVSAQAVLPTMREKRRGTILFTGGGLATTPFPQYASLSIGKAGIRNLTYSLAGEVAEDGIHVATVTVCGFVKEGTRFDPDTIAEAYWDLHAQAPDAWETEFTYK
ncbi:MAG: SDR family NAD(P)-dependent oxidoreductase [Myxococcales bacterium]|nr:SDR family NAD(P)-dependent oxidoreductase [Myxococcales bacterium]MCB9642580.1 SDR family NAD(P)-dependent oxidoreductase [Myxococcales bacterium]